MISSEVREQKAQMECVGVMCFAYRAFASDSARSPVLGCIADFVSD